MSIRILPGAPALLIEAREVCLVISDLHLGFERRLEAQGIHVPEQTSALLERAVSLGKEAGAKRLISIGDVKDELGRGSLYASKAVSDFFRAAARAFDRVDVVPGNHDGELGNLLPSYVRLVSVKGLVIRTGEGNVGLFHGHAYPSTAVATAGVLVTGHQHLILARKGERQAVWLQSTFGEAQRLRRLIVMPAFNPLLTGTPLGRVGMSRWNPVLSDFINPSSTDVFLQDGTLLGKLETLKEILEVEVD